MFKLAMVHCVGAIMLAGCGIPPLRDEFAGVKSDVEARTGYQIQWRGVSADDRSVDTSVQAMLREPLSADQAVEIALLNNRNLQASYEDLGVAQADLVQAGLLKNPVFSAGVRFPFRSPKKTYLDLSVEEDFIDIFFVPARKKLARAAFDQARSKVTASVLQMAADTRKAYVEYQSAEQMLDLRGQVMEAQSVSFDTAKRLHEAGNTTELALLEEQSQFGQARVSFTMAKAAVDEAREHLTGLMGLWGADADWKVAAPLAALPEIEGDLNDLEGLAVHQRADLRAAQQDAVMQAQVLGFARDARFLSSLSIGPEAERETDGQWRVGPSLSVPVPVFDQGQAGVARAVALLHQSEHRYFAMGVSVRSEVRAARNRMKSARERVEFYRRDVLPVQQKLLQQTQLQYNGMLVGVFQLLQSRRDQMEAGSEYINALRDYWIARIDLERAVGGRLPDAIPSTQTTERSK